MTLATRTSTLPRARSLSLSVGLAGLGGDVRTYQPSLEFTQFIPVRKKRSEYPHVFGFRIIAGTVGPHRMGRDGS